MLVYNEASLLTLPLNVDLVTRVWLAKFYSQVNGMLVVGSTKVTKLSHWYCLAVVERLSKVSSGGSKRNLALSRLQL